MVVTGVFAKYVDSLDLRVPDWKVDPVQHPVKILNSCDFRLTERQILHRKNADSQNADRHTSILSAILDHP